MRAKYKPLFEKMEPGDSFVFDGTGLKNPLNSARMACQFNPIHGKKFKPMFIDGKLRIVRVDGTEYEKKRVMSKPRESEFIGTIEKGNLPIPDSGVTRLKTTVMAMEPGDSFLFYTNGDKHYCASTLLSNINRRYGAMRFTTRVVPEGVRVWRVDGLDQSAFANANDNPQIEKGVPIFEYDTRPSGTGPVQTFVKSLELGKPVESAHHRCSITKAAKGLGVKVRTSFVADRLMVWRVA